jgi:predicted pyridoxine 5'-phosphate oxidase superfamily flavin-nucleotide-binding protein
VLRGRVGFHRGELAVQRRAGLTEQAARLAAMLDPPDLDGAMARFIAERDLAVFTSRDADRRIWTSAVLGDRGFCRAQGATLEIAGLPVPGDPLHRPAVGEPAGVLFVDFHRRRRLRVNGTLVAVGAHGFTVDVDQAFGNCPRHIRSRVLERAGSQVGEAVGFSTLEPQHVRLIERCDTFILGTMHPSRGADTSHRGGEPGFVRVHQGALRWSDIPGNNMFNSLGNIVENPAAALLFFDFAVGEGLQLSGRAELEWIRSDTPGDDAGTSRRTRFTPERIVAMSGLLVDDAQI